MVHRLVVSYGQPADPAAFDAYYRDVHTPLALQQPGLVRLTFGVDHRRLLPLAALVGAIYLVVVDLLSRTVDPPNELPLNILTALFGAPFFIWLMRRDRSLAHS